MICNILGAPNPPADGLHGGGREPFFRLEKRELGLPARLGIALPTGARTPKSRSGQSLIESCIVIGILCLLLMALFQLSQLYMAQEILHYAAGRGARAKAVGFNEFMVFKTIRVGTIANAGQITAPEMAAQAPVPLVLQLGSQFQTRFPVSVSSGPGAQRALERSRIPLFLASDWYGQLSAILNYEDWGNIHYSYTEQASPPQLNLRVYQQFPLKFPFHHLFYADDSIPFTGTATLDNHYPLYLEETP